MATNEPLNAAMNQYRRPHYASGDVVRVIAPGAYQGWQGVVESYDPVTRIEGTVATYVYHVRMANQGVQVWPEESLAPLTEGA